MEFEDSFLVPVPPDVAWEVLTDIERVYPCLPGAELKSVDESEFNGLVTIKFGPITAVYQGTARFEDLDPDARTLVIRAEGRDKHGQGTAKALVSAKLFEDADSTRVEMWNQVEITGKAAQFGRGVLPDVSKEILGEFADNLRQAVNESNSNDAGATFSSSESAAQVSDATQTSINAFSLGRRIAARRARESPGTVVIAALVAALLVVVAVRHLTS